MVNYANVLTYANTIILNVNTALHAELKYVNTSILFVNMEYYA